MAQETSKLKQTMNIQKSIKIIFAVMLFLCLAPMPYGYYQLLRVVAMVVFIYFAGIEYKNKSEFLPYLFIGLAILFQPFYKIALGRTIWNIVDVVVGIGLLIYVFKPIENKCRD